MVHYSTPSTASANFASGLACDSSTRNHPDGGDDPILGYELHRFQGTSGAICGKKRIQTVTPLQMPRAWAF